MTHKFRFEDCSVTQAKVLEWLNENSVEHKWQMVIIPRSLVKSRSTAITVGQEYEIFDELIALQFKLTFQDAILETLKDQPTKAFSEDVLFASMAAMFQQ